MVLTQEYGCKGQVLEEVGVHMCVRLCPGAPYPSEEAQKARGQDCHCPHQVLVEV